MGLYGQQLLVHTSFTSSQYPTQMRTSELAERMATPLEQAGINVLIDDRDERAGVKFKDADLIGIPYRIIVGKDAASGKVEWIDRINNTKDLLDASAVVERISTIYSGSKTI